MVSHPSDQSNMNDAGDGFDSDDQPMVGQSTSPYTPSPGPVVKRIAAHSTPQSSSAPASFASRRSQMHNNPLLELQAVEDNGGESHLSDNSDDDPDSASDLSNVTQGVTPHSPPPVTSCIILVTGSYPDGERDLYLASLASQGYEDLGFTTPLNRRRRTAFRCVFHTPIIHFYLRLLFQVIV